MGASKGKLKNVANKYDQIIIHGCMQMPEEGLKGSILGLINVPSEVETSRIVIGKLAVCITDVVEGCPSKYRSLIGAQICGDYDFTRQEMKNATWDALLPVNLLRALHDNEQQ